MDCTLKLVTDHPDKARREIRVVVEMTAQEALHLIDTDDHRATATEVIRQLLKFQSRLRDAVAKPKPKYPVGTALLGLWSSSQYVVIPRPEGSVEPARNVFFLGLASGCVYSWAEEDVPLMYRVVAS